MRLRTLHLMLFVPFTSAIGTPDCVRPAPPLASLPTIADCDKVLSLIANTARLQRNMPLTWSRHPPRTSGRKLPAYYSYASGNECEFVVDVKAGRDVESEEDVFPMGDVVFIGRSIVLTCLIGEAGAEDTLGSNVVGPREVVEVTLRKKEVKSAVGGILDLLNGTLLSLNGADGPRTLERAENVSG